MVLKADDIPWRIVRRSGIALATICEQIKFDPDCFYHVGVGHCLYEVEVMQMVWPELAFVGVEPNPGSYANVCGRYPGRIDNIAFGKEKGVGTLWNFPRHKDGSSLFEHYPSDKKAIKNEVRIETMDEHWGTPVSKSILWVDCEGSELDVLLGGVNFLRDIDVLNIEITGKPRGDGWCDAVETHNWILSQGFYLQWMHTQRSSIGQTDNVYVRRQWFHPQFSCHPESIERFRNGTD